MLNVKAAGVTIAASICLSLASSAQANMGPASLGGSVNSLAGLNASAGSQTVALVSPSGNQHFTIGNRLSESSETASFFYVQGVKKLEDHDLDKAESAFKTALRADGSKSLDLLTLHYLAYINQQQGEEAQAKTYAKAYAKLKKG